MTMNVQQAEMLMCSASVSLMNLYWIYIHVHLVSSAVTPSECNDGDVQLVDGATEYEGRVEVCVNGVWSTVCAYSGWYSNAARIVCNQIGALTQGF